ncbi:ATP-dependent helicase HrpB [Shewanella sp. NIFS-20-20]|uniref:ATP-dependent helicase HrpB n=1 Tax=Shewanella sp. NIFS-20-20 TaxID=2853806 RepID=UPI001C467D9F|nr:ATP-dependent helicase HrpB [Shewanella sp. NIFS-20-20]MBV7314140.1 ATP-dependent helicase HrpB [Shewanella sp. NIFS-20-20]
MSQLPIHDLLPTIRAAITRSNQVILEAPTGAGKSTALPLAMLDWSEINGRIIMLEPRRVAARAIAHFIAQQRQQAVGNEVGYRVRGETRISSHTRLEIVTEGVLTRMIQADPELSGVALVIFDEIHERHLTTDLSLALALEVQSTFREDLILVAMSATLSGLPLAQLMPNAANISSEGRMYPVSIDYHAPKVAAEWLPHMGRVITSLVAQPPLAGHVLAFLPGKAEINKLQHMLSERLDSQRFLVVPLYGAMSSTAQDLALADDALGRTKVVLATNVAESSLTIAGVTMVVDSGWQKQASYQPRSGVSLLRLKRISQASALQRSGRAGRTAPGVCIRLWPSAEFDRQAIVDDAEILHADLSQMALDASQWGVRQLNELPLLTAAPPIHEQQAWQLLQDLTLVDEQHKQTKLGRLAHGLGCAPRLAHMLLAAVTLAKQPEQGHFPALACLLASIIEARGLPTKGADIYDYLTVAQSGQLATQARQWLKKLGANGNLNEASARAHPHDIGLLLALAFPDRIAKRRSSDGFVLANGTGVTLESAALSQQQWLVVADFQQHQGQSAGRVYLASPLDAARFGDTLAHLVSAQSVLAFDDQSQRVCGRREWRIGQVVWREQVLTQFDSLMVQQALLQQVARKGLGLLAMTDEVKQLQLRLALAHQWDNQHQWPDMSDGALLATLDQWLAPYVVNINSLAQLAKLNILDILQAAIPWPLRQTLQHYLPESWPMATGSRAPIRYDEAGRALLSVRLQEALGMAQSPSVANGQLAVTMELLSPARRPLALTQDLASFWAGPYLEVKKEMKGRYPKHLWPDDPQSCAPTKHTKKRTQQLAAKD